ncbi:MAG: YciI family protein [Chloroflexia bacterium]
MRGGKRLVTDGPFAETHEQLGGYYIVDVDNLDEALAVASQIPGAKWGTVEVRPVLDISHIVGPPKSRRSPSLTLSLTPQEKAGAHPPAGVGTGFSTTDCRSFGSSHLPLPRWWRGVAAAAAGVRAVPCHTPLPSLFSPPSSSTHDSRLTTHDGANRAARPSRYRCSGRLVVRSAAAR